MLNYKSSENFLHFVQFLVMKCHNPIFETIDSKFSISYFLILDATNQSGRTGGAAGFQVFGETMIVFFSFCINVKINNILNWLW